MPSSQAARRSRTDRMNFTRPSHADIHRAELDVGWVCLTDRVETRAGQATRTQRSHGPPQPSNAFDAKVLEPPEPGRVGARSLSRARWHRGLERGGLSLTSERGCLAVQPIGRPPCLRFEQFARSPRAAFRPTGTDRPGLAVTAVMSCVGNAR
jgi:hypothetical protein